MAKKVFSSLLAGLLLAVVFYAAVKNAHAAKKWTVDFRLAQWKTVHTKSASTAESRYKTLKSLGCEVQKYAHNGHTDVKYRQVKWRTLSFDTDEEAHKWQAWLKKMVFQTKHTH